MLAALAPEKGRDPQSGEDRRHQIPVFVYVMFITF